MEDARSIVRQSADALRRARGRSDAGEHTVRLGVSLHYLLIWHPVTAVALHF